MKISQNPITITLTPKQSAKIRLMQRSISEPTTYHKVLDGLIDVGFASALKILYEDGQLNQRDYQAGLNQLPDYLRGSIGN